MAGLRIDMPYLQDKRALWLKGNLHTHTTRSDGQSSPQEMIRAYAKLGLDFLMLSDHDVFGDVSGLDPCGMVLITGNEISGNGPHLLDVGARTKVAPHQNRQRVIDAIAKKSGFPILCHPNWLEHFNHYPYETLLELEGYAGVEIFNGVVLDLPGSHLAIDKWDRLLAAGKKVWGYAHDDAHCLAHVGRGCNIVRARSRTKAAILDALRNGSFYASSGVEIESITSKGSVLIVRAPKADLISVFAPYGARIFSSKGPELRFDTSNLMAPFVRVECYGRGGATAWTQPIVIWGGSFDAQRKRSEALARKPLPTLKALHSDRAPEFTGKMLDPLWKKAKPSSRFLNIRDGSKPAVKTELRAIATSTHVFLSARCEEPQLDAMRVSVTPENTGAIWSDDSVEFFFDIEGKGRSECQIIVNAAGSFMGTQPGTVIPLVGAMKV